MRLKRYILILLVPFLLTACHDIPEYTNNNLGNFDALTDIINTHYCYFKVKKESYGLDWDAKVKEYRSLVRNNMSQIELFDLCSSLINELHDGHTNLISKFDVSYYHQWWSDYPQNFNLRTLEEYYFKFESRTTGGIKYQAFNVDDECIVGYMYYPSFSSVVGEGNLDYVLAYMTATECEALIIDIRDNGGGYLSNVGTFVSRFITEEKTGGYIIHKTGPGPEDFSEPYRFTFSPAGNEHISWSIDKPVYILTNRSCYSAANNFVAIMKTLPNVKIVGARTGGGGGMPFSQELPNGWSIRFSACPILDPNGNETEFGIDPTPGYEKIATDEQLAEGHDAILNFALIKAKESMSK